MDCQMPVLGGYQTTRAIRKTEGEISGLPIFAITANATSKSRDPCLASGLNDFLSKPVRTNDVATLLDKWH